MSKKGKPVFCRSHYAFNWKYKIFPRFFQNVFWEIPTQFFRDLRFCGERIRKGYCGIDVGGGIDDWVESVLADMLEELRDTTYVALDMEDDGTRWHAVLDEMIFLFREMNEDTRSRKNPLEEEYKRRWQEFEDKYGPFGEKLRTEETKNRYFSPRDLPENRAFYDRYWEEFEKLEDYREDCKDKAFALFSKYYDMLGD